MTDLSALTPLERATLRALCLHGTPEQAAAALGEDRVDVVRARLSRARRRAGADSIVQLAFALGQEECRRAA